MVHEFIPGEIVGRYGLIRRLAEGGMGCVWLAHDQLLERDVAIKLLPRLKVTDDSTAERFHREARAMGRLHHPRVISVFDIGSHQLENGDSVPFIVMELVHGKSLDSFLRDGPILPRRAASLMLQVAQAMAVAHRAGIVHRDLKPSNIMVTVDGDAKVLDFGLARLGEGVTHQAEATLTAPGMVLGSCPYMAPEQALGKSVDARADLFSFGAVLYELLAGKRAFDGATPVDVLRAVVACMYQPLEELSGEIPGELCSIVTRCLEKDPSKRYQTAEALIRDLESFLADTSIRPDHGRVIDGSKERKAGPDGEEKFSRFCFLVVLTAALIGMAIGLWLG